ncbi:hypothetical protein [Natronolimnobius baerhuensis]|uniref:Uncharacterized protein n=1 Tax=Natronolimnobius baerhuensis TaxID=253108 RepID=A0A202E586_9EURY|nr:hypothetical protein [Natronolimnobius baerhuensis]OVE83379.1 hypothetical protein B2G88_13030 [Natronolimnobius baerhuensis]
MAWTSHVDELLYDGERERHRLEFAHAMAVVTNHRVLVFTDGDGPAYRHIDRPNVGRVVVDVGGEPRHLGHALVPGLLGALLLAVSALAASVDLGLRSAAESMSDGGSETTGLPSALDSAFGAAETLLSAFELGLLALGALALCGGLFFCARYARSRSRAVRLTVYGDDDITFPVADIDIENGRVTALNSAIQPGDEHHALLEEQPDGLEGRPDTDATERNPRAERTDGIGPGERRGKESG